MFIARPAAEIDVGTNILQQLDFAGTDPPFWA
jgi:hypothetical protein